MPTNTIYNPENKSQFGKSNLQFAGKSIYFECASNSENNGDLTLTEDHLLTGGMLLVKDGEFHDEVSLQIVHPTYGVVNEFVSKFRIIENDIHQFMLDLDYPAKLTAGLTIRVHYKSSEHSAAVRDIALNIFLHRILI